MVSATTAAGGGGGGGSNRSCFKVGETRRSAMSGNVEVVLVLTTSGAASSELRSRIISGF